MFFFFFSFFLFFFGGGGGGWDGEGIIQAHVCQISKIWAVRHGTHRVYLIVFLGGYIYMCVCLVVNVDRIEAFQNSCSPSKLSFQPKIICHFS